MWCNGAQGVSDWCNSLSSFQADAREKGSIPFLGYICKSKQERSESYRLAIHEWFLERVRKYWNVYVIDELSFFLVLREERITFQILQLKSTRNYLVRVV